MVMEQIANLSTCKRCLGSNPSLSASLGFLLPFLSSRYYTGQTVNIKERLKRHNQGGVLSTKHSLPWEIVFQIETETRSQALALEKKIKKRGAKRFIEDYYGVYHATA